MKGIPVIAKPVKESLILLGHFLLNKVWNSLRNRREGAFDSSLVAKSANASYKKGSTNRGG